MEKLAPFAVILGALVACSSEGSFDPGGGPKKGVNGTLPGATGGGRGGGGGNGATDDVQTQNGLPCDVDKVLKDRCQACHGTSPSAGASTSLVTWDDLQKPLGSKKLYEAALDRIKAQTMPPAAKLGATEISAFEAWVMGGAKTSDAVCNGGVPSGRPMPLACDAPATRTTIKAASKFTWSDSGVGSDRYVCFGADEAVGSKRHVIGLAPHVDNPKIVHHILLFQTDESVSNAPAACSATTSGSWKLITGWAPGGGNLVMPPEAGFPEEGTTHWVMQVHYNNAANLSGQEDDSGYELCSTDQLRPNDAGVMAPGSMHFTIPPRTSTWTQRCDYRLGDKYQGVKLFGGSPHMHKLGKAISTERIPGGNGTPEMIFQQSPFSFEQQANTRFDSPKTLAPGDVLRTRCTWTNGGDTSVSWGEGTADEMCFNFFTYYPAIPDITLGPLPIQTWVSPALWADCSEEK